MFDWLDTLWGVVMFNDKVVWEVYNADFIMIGCFVLALLLGLYAFITRGKS